MKKKIFALVLALVMALSLAACGDNSTPAGSGSASGSQDEPANISGDLVICSSATDLDLEAITEGFTALYPDVNIEIITCSAGEGVARVEAEGDNPTIDVFYSGLNQADGVANCRLTAPTADLAAAATALPVLGTVTITEMED